MTVTEQVDEGAIVEQGDVLWRLGTEPTVLLYGDAPMFRDLAEGTEGPDVAMLEEALTVLGYNPDGDVVIDEAFTSATEAMVELWQEDIGAEINGVVHHGSVVFASGPSRIGETAYEVGDLASEGVAAFQLLALDTEVAFIASPADRHTLTVGDTVEFRFDGGVTSATVVSTTVITGGGAAIVAVPNEPLEIRTDEVPVTVSWSLELASDVATVPAESLFRTEDGVYHVEMLDAAGNETLMTVEVGYSSNGRVEVRGDLNVGDRVIVP